MDEQLSFSIVNTAMAVQSMRSSGYKSTTHALAELVDNSIEAGATAIELIGVSRTDRRTGRMTLKELAVLDNGQGMDEDTLRRSLRYGDGTRTQRKGIGRFGLGLPNSSMSQAKRVEVWSWQSGITNALHTQLAISLVEEGEKEIPCPRRRPLPRVYREAADQAFGHSGTLIVWRELDNVEWKRVSTTFKHTEALLGRMYRRFLAKESERLHPTDERSAEIGPRRSITCVPVEDDGGIPRVLREAVVKVRPNDPLYLMTGTSCPEGFGPGPMFEEHEMGQFTVRVKYRGEEHLVRVRASHARPHARSSEAPAAEWDEKYRGRDAGRTPWGKHADYNMGVSVVRAHREIELDRSWTIGYTPEERWWKIEIDFPTALDEIFGVTNNKQGTMTFRRLASFDWKREALEGEMNYGDVRRRMEGDGDPRVYLLELQRQIRDTIGVLRKRVKQTARVRGPRHVVDDEHGKADDRATAAIKKRIADQHESRSDRLGEEVTPDQHKQAQIDSLVDKHRMSVEEALSRIVETDRFGRRVRWIRSAQTSPAFFEVESLPALLQVAINMDHPVHRDLYEVMHPDVEELEELDEPALRARLAKAGAAFRLLVYAWARYEDEQSSNRERRTVRDARLNWGKYAEEFFDDGEDDDSVSPVDV